jgi:hypothetical protein
MPRNKGEMTINRRLLVALLPFLLATSLGVNAEASEPVYWKSLSVPSIPSQIEPESINVSSGTGSGTFSVFDLNHWRDWGTGTTYATGIARVKNCRPSCADGGLKNRPARVKFSAIRSICGQRRYMNVQIRIFDQPKAWTFGPWGSDCRGAQILRPYGSKPKPPSKGSGIIRTCGLLPGDGGYSYVRTRGVTCRIGGRVSRKARKKFCSRRNSCSFAPYTPSSITRTYRGRVKRNGWKCSVVVKWEFSRVICRKKGMRIRAEGGA